LALCVLACYWGVLIHQLGAQWSVYEQYHYGWAVPFLCLYLLWRRLGVAQASSPAGLVVPLSDGPVVPQSRSRWSYFCFPLSAFCFRAQVPLVFVAVLYAPTRLLHEANPIWRLTSLLLALEVIVLTLCFVCLIGGLPGLRRFMFPIAFFLVAVPWPSGLEGFVVQSLTRWNVGATVELLALLGVPAIQHGNVIEIGAGMVGIDEACSGIRSFQATLMISLFLGEFYLLGAGRRALCVLAGFACSFLFNLGRTSFLTWVGATKGTAAIAHWHDPAGVTILVACFLSLWALSLFLKRSPVVSWSAARREEIGERREKLGVSGPIVSLCRRLLAWWSRSLVVPSSRGLVVLLSLLLWFLAVEIGTELWFRSHENRSLAMSPWDLKSGADAPGFAKVEIPGDILGQFKADEAAQRLWRDPAGNSWQHYYFRWLPGHSLAKRVTVQLAKTHGPEKCLPAIGMTLKSYLGVITVPVGGMSLAFQQYLFTAEGRPLHVFYGLYEDPAGSAVLANRRKDSASRVAAALAGSRNYGQRFLEIAISGPEQPLDARAALTRSLPALITSAKR
jgi:exosortase